MMLDPFFPIALFCGPLAFAFLISTEAKRTDSTFWPRAATIMLALPAAWGLSYWVLTIAVTVFGERMNAASFSQVEKFATATAIAIVGLGYLLVVRARRRRVLQDH